MLFPYALIAMHVQSGLSCVKLLIFLLAFTHTAVPAPFLVVGLATLGTGNNFLIHDSEL